MCIGIVQNVIQSNIQNVHIDKHTIASQYVEKFHAVHYRLQLLQIIFKPHQAAYANGDFGICTFLRIATSQSGAKNLSAVGCQLQLRVNS